MGWQFAATSGPEHVASAFRQTPIAVVVTIINAALMVAVAEGDPRALLWFMAIVLAGTMRLVTWQAYRHDPGGAAQVAGWATALVTATAINGLLWGAGAAWLWPDTEAERLFWVFAIGGMCAGAAALHHAHLPTTLAFVLPAGLPVAACFALDGTARGGAAAAMALVFLAALVLVGHRSSQESADHLRIRLDLARKARELDAINARLQHTVADHEATAASLRQAQKMEALGQLTGGVAHDFNNLLMAILGSLALLRRRLPAGDATAERLLGNAVQAADRGALLTARLLAFGRRQTLRPEPVDLPALVRGMTELLHRSIGPGQRLRMDFLPALPSICADANQLELALLNLVLNARDAMPAEGTVTIAATTRDATRDATATCPGLAAGRYGVLSVTDTGAGMDPETLARATEPFFTTKGVGRGTGLGLSMVHGLAAQSGGRLVLQSQVGVGTVAELWLPLAAAEPPAAAPAAPPELAPGAPSRLAPSRRLMVLVVDDDPLVLESAAGMIESLGHQPVVASSALDALGLLADEPAIDLVITDYGMPEMSGLQLAGVLRRAHPLVPVLMASGYGDIPTIDAVALPRLCKPFSEAALHAAIEAAAPNARRP